MVPCQPSLLPAPHPASSSHCASRVAFPSSRFRRSSELALEARSALLTTASTCAIESLWLQGQGHPGEDVRIGLLAKEWPPCTPGWASSLLCLFKTYLSDRARASSAQRLQFVGCCGISWGISLECKQQH